jgi:RimJ/RimL family protein N-acetyltransferase
MAVNAASRRVMEKSGLRLVRLHDCADTSISGSERGEVEYEIHKLHWESSGFPWGQSARIATSMIA